MYVQLAKRKQKVNMVTLLSHMGLVVLALIVLSVGGLIATLSLGRNRYSDFTYIFTIVCTGLLMLCSIILMVNPYS